MKKILALFVLFMFVLGSGTSSADRWLGKRHKSHERAVEKAVDHLPDLVVVERGPRYYGGTDLIYYPTDDYKGRDGRRYGRCKVRMDEYHRPRCYEHNHYGAWRYRDFGPWHRFHDHGGCYVIWNDGGWYCDAHSRRDCAILLRPPYVRGGSLYFGDPGYDVIERSHQLWESQGRSTYVPPAPPAQWDVEEPVQRQLLFGAHGAVQPDGTAPWCFHHYKTSCVVIEGPLNGRPVQIKGQMQGPDGQNHSYYCPLGGNCGL